MVDVVFLARDLIRCASVTPADAGALGVVEQALAAAGFATHRLVFSEPGWPDTDNLYARLGEGSPCLVFAGHTDVVPPGDASRWRFDPFSGEIADGKLWGRGAVDMKGAVAASLAAVLTYLKRSGPPKGSIVFLITGDEEGPAVNGMPKLLEWTRTRGEVLDHCILGEPTNPESLGDMMKIGRRGSLSGSLTMHGVQGHVGYPHLADNPVYRLAALVAALRTTALDSGTQHFDASNLEVTGLETDSKAVNIIPAEARAMFNIRFNDLWTPTSLEAEIRQRVAMAAQGARVTLQFQPTNALAFLTQPGRFVEFVAKAIEAETGLKPKLSTTGGTSDARFIRNYAEVVEFGLVGKTMHAIDEHVAIEDLEKLTAIYTRILDGYFSR